MMNHNDFPKMTDEFDRSVRAALDSLPERERRPVRRFSAKRAVCAGLAAALCIGGTAFAANAQSWFPLLFPHGGDAVLEGYVQTADNARLTDENEHYRLSVESVLFDESAGTAKTVLAVDLLEFRQMPYRTSENGDVTLSQSVICTEFQRHFHGLKLHQAEQRTGMGGPARCQINRLHRYGVQRKVPKRFGSLFFSFFG